MVGASGAIFGLMGAFLVIQRRLGGNTTQLLVLLGINLVIGFIPGFNIAWQAHLGGLVVGALVGFIFVETRQRSRQALQVVAARRRGRRAAAAQPALLRVPAVLTAVDYPQVTKLSTGVSTVGRVTRV